MAVVTMAPSPRIPLPPGTKRWLWALALLDVMVAIWMTVMGDWLDSASPVTSVMTLGGHHRVVFGLAVAGFALIACMAPLTGGFSTASRMQLAVIPFAGVISLVALAGVLSVAILAMAAFVAVAVLFRRPPIRIDGARRRR
jgi:hypothetical protein